MGIGIGCFLPWQNGTQATGTRIWSLGFGTNVKIQKWEWDLSTAKWDFEKKGWETGLVPSPFRTLLKGLSSFWQSLLALPNHQRILKVEDT